MRQQKPAKVNAKPRDGTLFFKELYPLIETKERCYRLSAEEFGEQLANAAIKKIDEQAPKKKKEG